MFAIVGLIAASAYAAATPPAPPAPKIVAPAQPRAVAQSYFIEEDYPASAYRMGQSGTVRFTIDVGIDGRVSGCTIVRSSGTKALDSATCRIMRSRARFTPARDSNGNPAPSQVEQEVTWTLPPGWDDPPVIQYSIADSPPPAGYGTISNSTSPAPAVVSTVSGVLNAPAIAIPQDGPGEADLSFWDARKPNEIQTLGRYPSIPECRKAKAKLAIDAQQRAYCTVAPVDPPDLGMH